MSKQRLIDQNMGQPDLPGSRVSGLLGLGALAASVTAAVLALTGSGSAWLEHGAVVGMLTMLVVAGHTMRGTPTQSQ